MLTRLKPSPKTKLLVLVAFAPLVLSACSLSNLPVIGKYFGPKENPNVSTPVEVSMWGLWEPKEVMGVLAEDYKKEKPNVTVNYEERSVVGSLKSYKDSVFTRLSEGTAPDIVVLHNTWVPFLRDSLAPAPSGVVNVDEFYPVAKAWGSSQDQATLYAVPISFDGLALVYNRDMFTEAGISAPPSSWEEFRLTAVKLTKRDKDAITQAGAAIGTANNIEHFSDILGLMFAQASVKVPDDLTSQAASDALTFYTNFATQEKVWSDVLPASVEAFADRKVAMVFVPSWQVLNVLSRNPQLNIGVAAVPKALVDPEGGVADVTWGSFWMAAVSKSSKNSAVAWDYLRFITREEQARKFFSESSKIRAFGQPYALKSLQAELSGNAYLDVYVKSGDSAKSSVFAGRVGNDKETDALKTAVNSTISGTLPVDALQKVKESFGR